MCPTKIMAHRGASGYAPENTLEAFKLAYEQQADCIELDVHVCKSGELVVCHDDTVDRTTDGSGFIKDLTLDELKSLDASAKFNSGYKDCKIPTLKEVFEWISPLNLELNIELKNAPILYENLEEKLVSMIHNYNLEQRVILSSFNHYGLAKCKSLDPNIKTGLLYMAGLYEPWNYCTAAHANAIHPMFLGVLPEMITECKSKGIAINAWTVNDEPSMQKLISLNVDGLITNYPDKARKILTEISGN
jgi:glycerophosphoryl diester phosphodiesterase